MLWAAISFSALNLDRGNISQANSDNFLADLSLTTDGKILCDSCSIDADISNVDFNLGNRCGLQ
jgi:hypothetical protein